MSEVSSDDAHEFGVVFVLVVARESDHSAASATPASSSALSRFRAVWSRRLMVPIGASSAFGDLDQGLPLDVERDEGLTVEGLEPGQAVPEPLGPLAGDQLVERVVAVLAGGLEDLRVDAGRLDPPGRPVDRHPGGDLPEPAGEPLGLPELVEPLHDVEEDLLRQLDGLARVAQPPEADGVHGPLELLDQLAERLPVARAGRESTRAARSVHFGFGSLVGTGLRLATVAITGIAPPPILEGSGPGLRA